MKKLWVYTIYSLFLILILMLLATLSISDNKLKIIACDVGQGDGILIVKDKTQILIDGGPGTQIEDCLARYVPFWDRNIELVVLTHPDLDHYEGLISVFRSYTVKNYLANADSSEDESFKLLRKLISDEKSNLLKSDLGAKFNINNINLEIVNSTDIFEKENNNSIVLLLKYGNFDALFTGDIEEEANDFIAQNLSIQNVEYLKIPHHGSKNGLTKTLLDITNPKLSVLSVSRKNSYGHPHKDILEILKSSDTQILRTDEMGDVIVATDGNSYNIAK